jgi:N-acetylglucosamine-6-phosphate deacetylase
LKSYFPDYSEQGDLELSFRRITTTEIQRIENGTVITPSRTIQGGSVVIEEGKIVDVLSETLSTEKRISANVFDATNKIVIPGLIDIHTHGLNGGSAFGSNVESIKRMSTSFPSHGVTGFLPTTTAEPMDMLLKTAGVVAEIRGEPQLEVGAEVLGLNLEGPFISMIKPGAQPTSFIREPSFEELERIVEASNENVKLVTVAPELKGALEFIRKAKTRGVTVAAGHSNATYEEMIAGIDAGITHASHTFNAMREFKQRDPGMLAAILTRDEVTAELIADGVHVHEGAMKMLVRAKGVGKVIAISDSMPLAGMPDGKYDLMGFKIESKNGVLTLPGGQLAGSATTLEKSLPVMTKKVGITLPDAVKMASTNPARTIKVDSRKGSIQEGKDADIVILNREDLSVCATIIKGEVVYENSSGGRS